VAQEYLPDALAGKEPYVPGTLGFEKKVAERMAFWRARRQEPGAGQETRDPES
jgi:replication-associated recombination protein RarA